jgi:hypothetical protein
MQINEFGRHEAGDVEPPVVGGRAEDSYVDDIQDNASGNSENDAGAIDTDFANDVFDEIAEDRSMPEEALGGDVAVEIDTPIDEVDGLAAVLGSVRELPPDESNEVAEAVNSSDVSEAMGYDNIIVQQLRGVGFSNVGRITCWPSGVPTCRQSVAVRCYKLELPDGTASMPRHAIAMSTTGVNA